MSQPVVNKTEIVNYFNQWKHFRSSFEGFQLIMESQFNALDRLHDEYIRQHEEYEQYRKTSDETNRRLKNELNDMESKYTAIKEELANLKKVSIYTHLSKEMDDLRNYNAILEKQVKQLRANQNAKPAVSELAPPAPSVKDVEEVYDPQKDRAEDSDVEAEGDSDVEADEEAEEADSDEEVEDESEEKDEVTEENADDEEQEDAEDAEVESEENQEEVEDGAEEEQEDADEEEEEPEIEYESRKIGKKYYYVSNEEPVGIYLVIKESGEVGDKVGEYDENDKPVFYK